MQRLVEEVLRSLSLLDTMCHVKLPINQVLTTLGHFQASSASSTLTMQNWPRLDSCRSIEIVLVTWKSYDHPEKTSRTPQEENFAHSGASDSTI